jgi:P27 family predicted phage terminase small subunit
MQVIPIRAGFPKPPKSLNEAGKVAWGTGQVLWIEGLLTERDLVSWQLYCEAFDEKKHCEDIVLRDGEYVLGPNKCYVQHPAIKRRHLVENVIRKYSQSFGLLPSARKKRPSVQQGVSTRKRD